MLHGDIFSLSLCNNRLINNKEPQMTYQIFQTSVHGTKPTSRIKYQDKSKAEKRLKILTRWYSPTYNFFIKELT